MAHAPARGLIALRRLLGVSRSLVGETKPELSFVVPVFNEEDSLAQLHAEIVDVCRANGKTYEILFVNDGSRDGTERSIDSLGAVDPHVRGIHLRRNFGKSPALAAGFERAEGQVIFTLDGDLQDNPAMVPQFLERIEGGADLVSGWKQRRNDPLTKRLPSKLFNGVVRMVSGIPLHDFNCGFKAYRAECIQELSVYGGFHRYLPVLAGERGFRIEELVVDHRARKHGKSKFGVGRFFDGLLDLFTVLLVTRFRTRPLHFFGIPGLMLGLAGLSILVYLTVIWFMGEPIGTRPLLTLGVLLTLASFQFVCMGLLGELLVRTTVTPSEIYSVRRESDGPDPSAVPESEVNTIRVQLEDPSP